MNSEIKAIIIEDIVDYISAIEMLLEEVAPYVKVVGKTLSLTDAERLIEEISPDVVLLDIQFENEGKTGFDLLDSLKRNNKINFHLIIITAHIEKQYYAKAFEYKALHFLEKPINKYKLADAFERVRESMLGHKIDALANKMEKEIGMLKSEPKSSKINIEGVRYNEIIDLKDIIWIEADGRRSYIYLQNERKIVSSDNIGLFEKQLKCNSNFFRINRSEIININFIERYSKKEKLVVLSGKFPNHFISKDRFNVFIEKINVFKSR